MFDANSRYYGIEEMKLTATMADGTTREVAYVRRRFVPPLEDSAALAEHAVVQGDRLDNVTATYVGDPTEFWRIADANLVMSPLELTDEPGERITIPFPTF